MKKDVDCIVEGGFRLVSQTLSAHPAFEVPKGLASDILTVFFRSSIMARRGTKVKVELLKAGVFGPVKLTSSTTMVVNGIPFLTPSEFVRAKVKAWTARGYNRDKMDVLWILRTADWLDPKRINPDGGLDDMAEEHPDVAALWEVVRERDEDADSD